VDVRSAVTSIQPFSRAHRAATAPEANTPTAARAWHAGWALAIAAGAGVLLATLGQLTGAELLALVLAAAPGALGAVLPPKGARGRAWRFWAAAAAAGVAMALTGGLGGPLAGLAFDPLLVALAYGGLWRDATAPAFALLAAVAVAQAGRGLGPTPEGAAGLGLALTALASSLGAGAAALMRLGVAASPAPSPASGPESELQARLEDAEAARAYAEADAQAKMRFLANMSHELRTPLNAIMGFSDIMRQRLFGELLPRYVEYAELIHESGGHLLDLINDVLDISKIEADRYVLAREVFDAREAGTAALRLVRQQADDAGVQLRGVMPSEPIEVDADRRALKQIVLNLVSNALKFTPAGGSISVTFAATADALEVAVADTGVGIAPEDLARLGRPFEQAGDAAGRSRGTGLGLSLVRAFARLHGGDMVLESRLGEGTAVTVRLPVLVLADAPPAPAGPEPLPALGPLAPPPVA
jgi:two-component system, cell cycle sensor histidine kinase DivJ